MRIRIQLFTLMQIRIRIQLIKIARIHAVKIPVYLTFSKTESCKYFLLFSSWLKVAKGSKNEKLKTLQYVSKS
jgi:hypothetical protein